MKKYLLLPLFFLLFSIKWSAFSQLPSQTQEQMIRDLETIHTIFEVEYAPRQWKEDLFGWNLDEEIEQAKMQVETSNDLSTKAFQQIITSLLLHPQDYHVAATFFSTESASLPFRVKSAEGRYFISWLDRKQLPQKAKESWNVGDEVLKINNQSIKTALSELQKKTLGPPGSKTNHALAENKLTQRLGSAGDIVPKGKAKIAIKHKGKKKTRTYDLEWDYKPERIRRNDSFPPHQATLETLFNRKRSFYLYDLLQESEEDTQTKRQFMGYQKSLLPPLGETLWQTEEDSHFHAYIYLLQEEKRIGFLRIPNYFGGVEEFLELRQIIKTFEKECDALVIDQTDNPGGFANYEHALASLLTSRPLTLYPEQTTLTQKEVFLAIQTLEQFESLPENFLELFFRVILLDNEKEILQFLNSLKTYAHFIVNQWEKGYFLTDPTYYLGISEVKPDTEAHYTKPLLLLVNELDFSAADFLPALLQDAGRATLMGTTTAGAGGFVLPHQFPNRFGIAALHVTGSIAYRPDGTPLENLGVTPDISYTPTINDLQSGYCDYAEAINAAVSNLVNF